MNREYRKVGKIHTKRKQGRVIKLVGGVLLSILVLAAVLMFGVNTWSTSITMRGEKNVVVEYGEDYQDSGAEAFFHGSLFFPKGTEVKVFTEGKVNPKKTGEYTITYSAEKYGTTARTSRVVMVKDTKPPVITLVSNPDAYTVPGEEYQEEGYEAVDNYDGDLTSQVTKETKDGKILYRVKDSSGNEAEVTRTIRYHDPVAPVIQLKGDSEITVTEGADFTEPGATASDNCDGDITARMEVKGTVDTNTPGTYTLTYSVSDRFGNPATAKRTILVTPKSVETPPSNPGETPPSTPDAGEKVIYLTFDDGPSQFTEKLLSILDKYQVKATFFVTKNNFCDIIGKEAAAGHTIALHTASHKYNEIYASDEAFYADLASIQELVRQQTGQTVKLIRFPGGSSNAVSRRYSKGIMSRLVKSVQEKGYVYVDWNVIGQDDGKAISSEQVFQNVVEGIGTKKTAVVLQHDITSYSVEAVEKIITWGFENGYQFKTLSMEGPFVRHDKLNN